MTGKPVRYLGAPLAWWRSSQIDPVETTAAQQEPRPGTAVPGDDSARLSVVVEGAQFCDLEAVAIAGGYPRPGVGGVGVRLAGETDAQLRGAQRPNYVHDVQTLGSLASLTADGDVKDAATCELDGKVALGPCRIWDPATNAVQEIGTTGLGTIPVRGHCSVAWVPGTTRLIAVMPGWVGYCDDPGPSSEWVTLGEGPVAAGPPTNGSAADALVFDGAGGLVWFHAIDLTGTLYTLKQYASADMGASWVVVDTGTDHHEFDACRAPDGSIYLVVGVSAASGHLAYRLGSAFDPFTEAEPTGDPIAGVSYEQYATICAACEPDGTLWVYLSIPTGAAGSNPPYHTRVFRSIDEGATWTDCGMALGNHGNDGGVGLAALRLDWCVYGGLAGVLLPGESGTFALLDVYGTGATRDYWARFVRLGALRAPGREVSAWTDYVPTVSDTGWVWVSWARPDLFDATVTGGPGTLSDDAWVLGTAQAFASYDLDTVGADEIAAEFVVEFTGSLDNAAVASDCGVQLRSRDGVNQRQVSVYFDAGGYRVRDELGATWLTSKIAAPAMRYNVTVSLDGLDGYVMHAADVGGAGTAAAGTEWTVTTFTTTQAASALTTSLVRFGQFSAVANSGSSWWALHADVRAYARRTGLANHPIRGRASVPEAYDLDRARVAWLRLTGGPGLTAQDWTLPAAYGYPHEAVFPDFAPSPDEPWRGSDAGEGDERIAVDAETDRHAGPVICAVRNANVRYVTFGVQPDAGGGYTPPVTLDLATGFDSISATREGARLTPSATSGLGARYLRRNELAGCWCALDPDGTAGDGTPANRRIASNTAGWWGTTTDVPGPQASVILEGVDGTEPETDFGIWLVWTSGVAVGYEYPAGRWWSVEVALGAHCPDPWPQIGTAYVCAAVPVGKQWATAEWTHESGAVLDTDDYGTIRGQRRGPARRALALTWDEGQIERRHIEAAPSAASYLETDGGEISVAQDDVRGQVLGLLEDARGGVDPVIVLLGDNVAASVDTITDSTRWFVGYVDGQVRVAPASREDPDTGEFVRVGTVTLRETT